MPTTGHEQVPNSHILGLGEERCCDEHLIPLAAETQAVFGNLWDIPGSDTDKTVYLFHTLLMYGQRQLLTGQ